MTERPPLPDPLPHVGPLLDEPARRHRFEPHELAIVLSHYELGLIRQIAVYARGSLRSPKVRIRAERGEFLLKRRAPGRDDPYRVAFAHSVQLHLMERGFPVPALVGTRDGNNSMLQLGGRIYEMFAYRPGRRYDGSPRATELAGSALGTMHALLYDFRSSYQAPGGTYHAAAGIDAAISRIPEAVAAREPQADLGALRRMSESLGAAYRDAASRVETRGFRDWPLRIIHGDWHPGNVLYGDGGVTAVLDFDSARLGPPVCDVANAALQFSMTWPAGADPDQGPPGLDLDRIRRLVGGYRRTTGEAIGPAELAALPWLMTEALVLEGVVPIAATGTFGRIPASRFLGMVENKVRWIAPHADDLVREATG